ncbi:hypothetical protein GF361_02255 [Candidatus Woesearchaeota archaeon]|nr:hypothetical protein [Candidatus Woesearchaeota archaeon]
MGELSDYDIKKVILFIGIFLVIIISVLIYPIEVHPIEFPAKVYVSDKPNFIDIKNEGERDALDFGGVSPGYKIEKFINLDIGSESPPAKVSFKVEGNIEQFIEIPSGSFVITEPVNVSVYANIPKRTKPGYYSGKVTVKYSLSLWRKFLNLF